MKLLPEFIEAVRAGKVKGVSWRDQDSQVAPHLMFVNGQTYYPPKLTESQADHLCAHLRRLWTAKGWDWDVTGKGLWVGSIDDIFKPTAMFCEGDEVEWHQRAEMWRMEQEAKDA